MHLEGVTTLLVWPCLVLTAPLAKLMHLWGRTAYWNERETSEKKAVDALFHEEEFYGGEGPCKTQVRTKRQNETRWTGAKRTDSRSAPSAGKNAVQESLQIRFQRVFHLLLWKAVCCFARPVYRELIFQRCYLVPGISYQLWFFKGMNAIKL